MSRPTNVHRTSENRTTALPSNAHPDDAGISLVELIVAVALTAIVSTLVVSVFIGVSRTVTRESLSATSSETATIAMRELSRIIRAGTPVDNPGSAPLPVFLEAGAHTLTLHAFTDTSAAQPRPTVVRFALSAGTLTETRRPATASAPPWNFATTPSPARTVARGMGEPASSTFIYLDAAGHPLEPPTGGVLSADQRARIAAVTITITVQAGTVQPGTVQGDATGVAPSARLENTVGIPNLGVSRVGRAS